METSTAPTPQPSPDTSTRTPRKRLDFWMIFLSLCLCCFMGALALVAVPTALPSIAHDLHGQEFTWVGNAYDLASTAFLPWTGGLAMIFGRRIVLYGCLAFFALGSALCGASQNMPMMIAGRTFQGIGGASLIALTEIVVCDLVPLRERGKYMGAVGAVWSLASAIGPIAGGGFAQSSWSWRALFYLMLPLTGFAFFMALFFFRLKTPGGSLRSKLARMDWWGNILFIASCTVVVIGVGWAGIQHPWGSAATLLPLILGLLGMGAALVVEARYVREPTIPMMLFSTRTSAVGYFETFLHSLISAAATFYMPVYFQAVKDAGPMRSSVETLSFALSSPFFATLAGASVARLNRYRPQNILAWAILVAGMSLLSLLKADSNQAAWVGYQFVAGAGIGALYLTVNYPILAALPPSQSAYAMAFFTFVRVFAQIWGITIGGAILQNELKQRLPREFLEQFSGGANLAYTAIPVIKTLPEPLRTEVHVAFSNSLRTMWRVLIGVAAVGFLSTGLMKELPMHTKTDENWGMEEARDASPNKVDA